MLDEPLHHRVVLGAYSHIGVVGLEGQVDLALLPVDVDDLAGQVLADVQYVLHVGDVGVHDFGDVQQGLYAVGELDDGAEAGHPDDGPLHVGALEDVVLDVLPGVLGELLHPQGDAPVLGVDVEDHDLDFVALADDFRGVPHPADPAHVADVHQAVYALVHLDEGPEIGDVAHAAHQAGAAGEMLGDGLPGVLLGLLEAEADALLLGVQVQHLGVDQLADGEHLGRVADALGPAHLGDVNQALYSVLDFDEGAVIGHVDDLPPDDGPLGVLLGRVLPGVGGELLEAERDPLALAVEVQNQNLHLVPDLEDFAGMADSAPAHVGDVQQAVDAAEVDEGSEIGDVLDLALANLTLFQLGDQRFLQLLATLLEHHLPREDDVASPAVDFQNPHLELPADEGFEVAHRPQSHLARGEESPGADVHLQAAFDAGHHLALDDLFVLEGGPDFFPGPGKVRLLLRQDDDTVLVFFFLQVNVHLVADFNLGVGTELLPVDGAFGLVAHVHQNLVAGDADDHAADNLAFPQVGQCVLVRRHEVVHGGAVSIRDDRLCGFTGSGLILGGRGRGLFRLPARAFLGVGFAFGRRYLGCGFPGLFGIRSGLGAFLRLLLAGRLLGISLGRVVRGRLLGLKVFVFGCKHRFPHGGAARRTTCCTTAPGT